MYKEDYSTYGTKYNIYPQDVTQPLYPFYTHLKYCGNVHSSVDVYVDYLNDELVFQRGEWDKLVRISTKAASESHSAEVRHVFKVFQKFQKNQKYDIIGDIHGHGTKLENLLIKMGYNLTSKGFSHPERTAIFVGDFVDGGEDLAEHKKVLDIVMPMVSNGHALAVMGNHEFNAIAFHTEVNGKPLREHNSDNIKQHKAFLNEFPAGSPEAQDVITFFKSLPLFLELDDFRVVHACWDDTHIDVIKKLLPNNKVTSQFMIKANTKGTLEYKAIERVLKGVEVELPDGLTFKDSKEKVRSGLRVNWWDRDATSLQEVSRQPDLDLSHIDIDLSAHIPFYPESAPLCFIGHYWLSGEPKPVSNNVICVDYAVAGGGDLVAFRYEAAGIVSFVSC